MKACNKGRPTKRPSSSLETMSKQVEVATQNGGDVDAAKDSVVVKPLMTHDVKEVCDPATLRQWEDHKRRRTPTPRAAPPGPTPSVHQRIRVTRMGNTSSTGFRVEALVSSLSLPRPCSYIQGGRRPQTPIPVAAERREAGGCSPRGSKRTLPNAKSEQGLARERVEHFWVRLERHLGICGTGTKGSRRLSLP